MYSSLVAGIILIMLLYTSNCNYAKATPGKAVVNKKLITLLLKSEAYNTTTNAELSACFNLFVPYIDAVANNYSVQYEQCTTSAEQQLSNLTAELLQGDNDAVENMNNTCTAFQNCLESQAGQSVDDETVAIDALSCYTTASALFELELHRKASARSVAATNELVHDLTEIKAEEVMCFEAAEKYYVTNTATAYRQLEVCLQNGANAELV